MTRERRLSSRTPYEDITVADKLYLLRLNLACFTMARDSYEFLDHQIEIDAIISSYRIEIRGLLNESHFVKYFQVLKTQEARAKVVGG